MAIPNSSYTEIIATTLAGYSGKLADNVTTHNALLFKINKRGNKQTATGRTIVQEIEYQENGTVRWYSGAEVLDTSASDVLTAAEFNYKQIAGTVTINGLEEIQNSGREQVHNLLRARIRNLENSLKNQVSVALFADGTGNSGKELGGLQLLVADDPTTGTVGGIDRSSQSWWQNKTYDFSTETGSAATATNIQTAMNTLWLNTLRGSDKVDTIVMDSAYYEFYWSSLQQIQRITSPDMGEAGFEALKFKSADVLYDENCPANHGYFLNLNYLYFRPAKGREFIPLGERASVNQDAIVMPVVWAGNMTLSNAKLQGVMKT